MTAVFCIIRRKLDVQEETTERITDKVATDDYLETAEPQTSTVSMVDETTVAIDNFEIATTILPEEPNEARSISDGGKESATEITPVDDIGDVTTTQTPEVTTVAEVTDAQASTEMSLVSVKPETIALQESRYLKRKAMVDVALQKSKHGK